MQTCHITVYEHETLRVGEKGFLPQHFSQLEKYYGTGSNCPYFNLTYRGIKFSHYVGVLCMKGLQIEVLPKIDANHTVDNEQDYWRDKLLLMLQKVYRLKLHEMGNARQTMQRSRILDVFILSFMNEVEALLHAGLTKAYHRKAEDKKSLKGHLLVSRHLVRNAIHKERFFVEHDSYDHNHFLNRILLTTLLNISHFCSNSLLLAKCKTLLLSFDGVCSLRISADTFKRIVYDRKTANYSRAMELAEILLRSVMPDFHKGKENVLALMFDMNRLWEEFVLRQFKSALKDYRVTGQESKLFWGNKHIRPDIVIYAKDNDDCVAIVDTKWKCPSELTPSDADLKQMYVYHKYWDTQNTILLYPSVDGRLTKPVEKNFSQDGDCICSMAFLPFCTREDYPSIKALIEGFQPTECNEY